MGWVLRNADVVTRVLQHGADHADDIVGQALLEEARVIMRKSLEEVPVRDGILKASATVEVPVKNGRMIVVRLGYGGAAAAYALYQHNAPDGWNYTKPGSKSHFLSDPVQAAVPNVRRNLERRIARITVGG